MTAVPPQPQWAPPQGPPPPQASPAPAPPARRPGRALPWVALALVVTGLVLAVAGLGGIVTDMGVPESYPVVAVPGERSVDLRAGRTYSLYLEVPAGADSSATPTVAVTAPGGHPEPLVDLTFATESYSRTGGWEGRPFAEIAPGVSGTYEVAVSAPTDGDLPAGSRVAIGDTTVTTTSMVAFGLLVLGSLTLIGGLVVGVVWLVRRGAEGAPSATASQQEREQR